MLHTCVIRTMYSAQWFVIATTSSRATFIYQPVIHWKLFLLCVIKISWLVGGRSQTIWRARKQAWFLFVEISRNVMRRFYKLYSTHLLRDLLSIDSSKAVHEYADQGMTALQLISQCKRRQTCISKTRQLPQTLLRQSCFILRFCLPFLKLRLVNTKKKSTEE